MPPSGQDCSCAFLLSIKKAHYLISQAMRFVTFSPASAMRTFSSKRDSFDRWHVNGQGRYHNSYVFKWAILDSNQ